jgi:hypothetical protein
MRSFTNKSAMSISCEITTTISCLEISFSFFTRRNAFFWLSWCFRISDNWSSSHSWEALLIADTKTSMLDEDKVLVFTINSTCAREAMLLEIWVLMKSFLNSLKVFESRKTWLIFFTDLEIADCSSDLRRMTVELNKTRRGCSNPTHWWGWTPYFVQWVGLDWGVCSTPKPNSQSRRPPPFWKKKGCEIIF